MKGYIAAQRGQVVAWPAGEVKDLTQRIERIKAHTRRRVEHVFHLIKDRFHPRQLRYRVSRRTAPSRWCSAPWPI